MTNPSFDMSFPGKGKRRIRGILIVLLAFMITSAAVVADVALRRAAEEVRSTAILLLQLQGVAYRLSALEWQAISERGMSSKIVAGVQEALDEMNRTMGSLERLEPDMGDLQSVRHTYDAYILAINEEFSLIKAGNLSQALLIDEELVDPAFDALTRALSAAGAAHHTQANQMEQLASFGSILILLLAIVTIGTLVWQIQKAQTATEAAAIEQIALIRGQAELSLFADNVPSMTASFEKSLHCVFANKRYADFFGFDKTDIIGKHLREIIGEKVYSEVEIHFAQVLQGRPVTYQRTFERQDGKHRYLEVRLHPDIGRQGQVLGCFAVAHDITEHKATESSIVHLNRVYAVLSGINTLIVRVRDRNVLFKEACRIAVEDGGFCMSMIGIIDRHTMKIVPVASAGKDETLLTAIKSALSSSERAPMTMVARAIREKKAVVSNNSQNDPAVLFEKQYAASGVRSMAVLPLILADVAAGVLVLHSRERDFFNEQEMKLLTGLADDISFAIDKIDKQERLEYIAYFDPLTGLANRTLFLERVADYLRGAVSAGNKLAVFLIDLERFKNINDSLGRPTGDMLLKMVAEWLTHSAGDASLLARIDADHFAVVMPKISQDVDLAGLIEKTLTAFTKHPFRLNNAVFRLAIKVGVALYPDDGVDADTLFRNAEAALKKAKASGERYLFHTQIMTSAVAGKLTLENQLRQALDKREFVLHYQPKVNLASGKVAGVEALIRWNDPRTGLVPPGRFIPILEETGLIYEAGRWALHQAVEDFLRWRAAGLAAVRIAVNVSPLQLRNRGFVEEVRQAISIDAHAAAGLELEITESLIMEDVERTITGLQAIRALGVNIAIDDFGTGFSSLSYLSKLPVDTLKIDRSFVIAMTDSAEALALVSTIINLAHSMKLVVVAEGVETDEQARLLRLLACDEMQGYLFSKPVPVEIFETRFLARLASGDEL